METIVGHCRWQRDKKEVHASVELIDFNLVRSHSRSPFPYLLYYPPFCLHFFSSSLTSLLLQ